MAPRERRCAATHWCSAAYKGPAIALASGSSHSEDGRVDPAIQPHGRDIHQLVDAACAARCTQRTACGQHNASFAHMLVVPYLLFEQTWCAPTTNEQEGIRLHS